GRVESPLKILLMGVPGVGKSTFAAGAPVPIFLGATAGESDELDVARFAMPDSWADIYLALRQLYSDKHRFKPLVIDTVDRLEPRVERYVVIRDKGKADNIDEIGGGFGKGAKALAREWRKFTEDLDRIVAVGMNVILLAHCQVANFRNPDGPDFDRYIMKL